MTSTPPWGTPPEQSAADDARADPAHPYADLPAASGYALVIEQQTGSGETMIWRAAPDPKPLHPGTTRLQAQAAALELARTFQPDHPWSPRRRTLLRLSPDSYLVLVQGATKTFHFRVSVAELLG